MKLAAMITLAAMAAANAQGKSNTARPVTVYVNAAIPFTVLGQAERLACDMFAVIGVTLKWRSGNPLPSEANAIAVDVVWSAPAAFKSAALALAFPYEGVHIQIFWGRIAEYLPASGCRDMQRAVSVVCLALSLIGRSQQKQYIMFYNTVILAKSSTSNRPVEESRDSVESRTWRQFQNY